jgi:hypothetical protein
VRQRLRYHLSYANVISTLALFLVLGGGTALAAYVVSSNSQIGPGTVSGHKPPSGNHANVIAGSVNGQDVADNALTGADIADRSGVDTCKMPLLAKFGPICAGSDGVARTWQDAANYCAGFGLRLASLSEASSLGQNYDVPGVSGTEAFWTGDLYYNSTLHTNYAYLEDDTGTLINADVLTDMWGTVCVTDPSA